MKFFKIHSNNKGFTLIEMLVVVFIISLLVSVGMLSFSRAQMRARDGRRMADLEQIRAALEIYRADMGYYPPNGPGWCTVLWGCLWGCDNGIWYDQVAGALISGGYLTPSLPHDPRFECTNQDYFYYNVSSSQYELYASLEADDNNSYDPRPGVGCACKTLYDYKLTSP